MDVGWKWNDNQGRTNNSSITKHEDRIHIRQIWWVYIDGHVEKRHARTTCTDNISTEWPRFDDTNNEMLSYAHAGRTDTHNWISLTVTNRFFCERSCTVYIVRQSRPGLHFCGEQSVLRCLNLTFDTTLSGTLKALHKEILPIRNHLYANHIEGKPTILGTYTISRPSFKKRISLASQKVSLQNQYCSSQEDNTTIYSFHKWRLLWTHITSSAAQGRYDRASPSNNFISSYIAQLERICFRALTYNNGIYGIEE